MKKIGIFLAFLLLIQNAYSQLISESVNSKRLQESRKIVIYTPEKYDHKQAYPLFVVLDAGYMMEPVMANARFYEYFEDMPESIIVGVFNTPEDVTIDEQIGFPQNQSAQFYDFLATELITHLSGKYKLSPFKGIVAEGRAAFFANYYLLKEKSIFDAYFLLNPKSLANINESLAAQLPLFKKPIFYYVATSSLERKEIYQATKDLDQKLRNTTLPESVSYYFEDFGGVSKNSVALSGIPRAFDFLFDVYKPISDKQFEEKILTLEENIFDYLNYKYEQIYQKMGQRKKPILDDILMIYEASLHKKDAYSLLKLSEFVADNGYKETALPNFILGEYYEQMNEPKKALKAYQKAYTQTMIDFITPEFIEKRMSALKN
ncbi:alpha/beta hydrolase [Capnocytophaga canimorsus]|uniref:alpha/beta hydrolase n=1 Tax=Capnocytophaga canimorsus TaxID=28188 RepID=UPI00385DD403